MNSEFDSTVGLVIAPLPRFKANTKVYVINVYRGDRTRNAWNCIHYSDQKA